jgi:DNA-binding MarR family transcriptional regulator
MTEPEKTSDTVIPAFLDEALGFNVYRAGLLFRRELLHALAEYGITPEQWSVMATLWSTGKPLNQSEITLLTMKDKHTVSRIIARLERGGWIRKTTDPNDARITMIKPTKKGMAIKEEVRDKVIGHFDVILKDFSDEEIDVLTRSIKKLRRALGDK